MNKTDRYNIVEVNGMDADTFVRIFGGVFEDSSWVAKQAWADAPFDSCNTLIETLCRCVRETSHEAKLTLLCAHPELGSQNKMAEASVQEQDAAGIRNSVDDRTIMLGELNRRYRGKFGFPFIIAVQGLNLDAILSSMQARLNNDRETEFDECIDQVFRIARIRLEKLLVMDKV